jgi:hypothetical protein
MFAFTIAAPIPLAFMTQMATSSASTTLVLIGASYLFGRKIRRVIALAVSLLITSVGLNAQSPSLSFIYPSDGQIVGGSNQLLYVASDDPSGTESVLFDVSFDGMTWTMLPLQQAPDFGVASYMTKVDLTQFPVGAVYFRARFDTDSTGPVIAVQNRSLPSASCKVLRLSSLNVRFDCSASTDSNGGIVSYGIDFGDGTNTVSATPSVTHSYPRFGVFPLTITVTDAVGLSSTSFTQLLHLQVDLIEKRVPLPKM